MRAPQTFEGDQELLTLVDPRRIAALETALKKSEQALEANPVAALFNAVRAGIFRETMLAYQQRNDLDYHALCTFGAKAQQRMPTVRAVIADLDRRIDNVGDANEAEVEAILVHVRDRIAAVIGRGDEATSYGFLQWLRLQTPEKRFGKALGMTRSALEKRRETDVLGAFRDLLRPLKATGHFRGVQAPSKRWELPVTERAARSYFRHAVQKGKDPLAVALIELLEMQGYTPTVEVFERTMHLPRTAARKLAMRMSLSFEEVSSVFAFLREEGFEAPFLDHLQDLWEKQPAPERIERFSSRMQRKMEERGWDNGDLGRILRIEERGGGKPSQYVRLALERDVVSPFASFAEIAAVLEDCPQGLREALLQKRREIQETLISRWPDLRRRVCVERQLYGIGVGEMEYDADAYKAFERGTGKTAMREDDVLNAIAIRGGMKVRDAVASAIAHTTDMPYEAASELDPDRLFRIYMGSRGYRWKRHDSDFLAEEVLTPPAASTGNSRGRQQSVTEDDLFGPLEHLSDAEVLQKIQRIAEEKKTDERERAQALRPLTIAAALTKGSVLIPGGFTGIHAATDTRGIERCHHLSAKELVAIARGRYKGFLSREAVVRVIAACNEKWSEAFESDWHERTAEILAKRHKHPLSRVLHGIIYGRFPSLHAFHRQTQMSKKLFDRTIAKIHDGSVAWERIAQVLTEADVRSEEPLWDFVEQLWSHSDLPRALRRWKKIAAQGKETTVRAPSGITEEEFSKALSLKGRATR